MEYITKKTFNLSIDANLMIYESILLLDYYRSDATWSTGHKCGKLGIRSLFWRQFSPDNLFLKVTEFLQKENSR